MLGSSIKRSIDLRRDPGITQLVVTVIFTLLAIIAVVLRLVSRRLSKVKPQLDDYIIIVALVGIVHIAAAVIVGVVAGGAGLHDDTLSKLEIKTYWTSIFIILMTWPIVQSAIKISVLLLYVHVFIVRPFRIAAYSLMVICSLWCVQQLLASLLLCKPIAFNLDRSIPGGHCGDVAANGAAGAAINTAVDIATVCLPMPIIWGLQLPTKSKVSLSFIFGLGGLICVISLVRLEALTKFSETDGSYRNSLPTILTLVESALGVISACLIVMRPIFGRFFPDRLKLTKRGGQSSAPVISRIKQSKPHRQTTRNPVDMKGISDGRFVRLDEDPYALPLLNADKAAAERVVDFGPVPTASHTAYKHRDVEAQ